MRFLPAAAADGRAELILASGASGGDVPHRPGLPAAGVGTGSAARQGPFPDESSRPRRICYLVDCSGSMQGVFGQVRETLVESIRGLEPDRFFYVIFFGAGRLFEIGDGGLIRATGQAKAAAARFAGQIRPAGRTNALAAFKRALAVRGAGGQRVSAVYFLTDGFELADEDASAFFAEVSDLMDGFAGDTIINVTAFWPQGEDEAALRRMAERSGGDFVLICDKEK
jgi:hypothetical protein